MYLEKTKIERSVALEELVAFLKKHLGKEFRRGNLDSEKVVEKYLDTIEAIEDGLMQFGENDAVTYTLREPLYVGSENTDLEVRTVVLRSRVRRADIALISDGLDLENKKGTYMLKILAYITQLHLQDVKNLGKDDYETLNQICSVF